jgi:hypothetical protein
VPCCCVLLQYVVETKFVGEQEMGIAGADIVDIKTRVVDVAQPGPTCPVNTGEHLNHVKSCAEQQPCLLMKSSTVAISSAGCLCSVNRTFCCVQQYYCVDHYGRRFCAHIDCDWFCLPRIAAAQARASQYCLPT